MNVTDPRDAPHHDVVDSEALDILATLESPDWRALSEVSRLHRDKVDKAICFYHKLKQQDELFARAKRVEDSTSQDKTARLRSIFLRTQAMCRRNFQGHVQSRTELIRMLRKDPDVPAALSISASAEDRQVRNDWLHKLLHVGKHLPCFT